MNRLNNIRSRIEFLRYLISVDRQFKFGLLIALAGLFIFVFRILFSEQVDDPTILTILLTIGSLLIAIGLFRAYKYESNYGPGLRSQKYVPVVLTAVPNPCNGKNPPVPMSDVQPSEKASSSGYSQYILSVRTNQSSFRNKQLDSWITQDVPYISFQLSGDMRHKFHSDVPEVARAQTQYLRSKAVGDTLTINELKAGLTTDLYKGIKKVNLTKVGYFDSLVSNEAFRSKIIKKFTDGDSHDVVADLSKSFPVFCENNGKNMSVRLCDLTEKKVASHIGISVFAISNDGFPVFMEQSINMDQTAGNIIFCGSGSLDFADIVNSSENDLLSIIRYGLARELLEESGIIGSYPDRKKAIIDQAKKTLVIGYARIIDRCGKPEFYGITRLNKNISDIQGDNKEVHKLLGDKENILTRTRVNSLSDIKEFYEYLSKQKRLNFSISAAILFERLSEISMLAPGSNEKKLVESVLFGSASKVSKE